MEHQEGKSLFYFIYLPVESQRGKNHYQDWTKQIINIIDSQ